MKTKLTSLLNTAIRAAVPVLVVGTLTLLAVSQLTTASRLEDTRQTVGRIEDRQIDDLATPAPTATATAQIQAASPSPTTAPKPTLRQSTGSGARLR